MSLRSIRVKLPLLITILLAGVVAAISWTGYREVEGALVASAERDLAEAARQLATTLDDGGRRARIEWHRIATDDALAAFLGRGDARSRSDARRSLERRRATAQPGAPPVTLELWDAARRPVLALGERPPGAAALARATIGAPPRRAVDTTTGRATGDTLPDPGVVTRLLPAGDSVSLGIVVPVLRREARPAGREPRAADTLGFVAEYRRIVGGAQVALIQGLIGREATFALGSPADAAPRGWSWTNLERRVDGPPPSTPAGTLTRVVGEDGDAQLGVLAHVPTTGWRVWVAMPRATVLAPAVSVVRRILVVALGVIVLGALAAWLVSRGITEPLAEVARAAEGIAAGEYAKRARVVREDELGSLADSFNSMAARIEESTRALASHAEELEHQVTQSQELAQELEVSNEELTEALRRVEASRADVGDAARRFQALVEHAGDLITIVDRDGCYIYASPAHERVLGTPVSELLGRSGLDRVHPDDLERVRTHLAAAPEHPGELRALSYRLRHADGSWRQLEAQWVALLDDPAIRGIVVNARDVTAQQRLEGQFLQAQKMEAVGRLAGGVAHDFNNILTAIKSYSQLAVEELGEDAPLRADVLEIDRAADRAATLTRQLLAFSRQQVLRPKVLDLNETVRGMENMLRRLLMEDVSLESHLAPGLGHIEADPGQIEQVLMNLVVNARDAMPHGGQLTIETANADVGYGAHPEEGPQGFQPGRYIVLSVSDTGEGMSRETQAKIFEPFYTTKDQGKGTGLGLSTVYGIVKQSGGFIWVYSELGQGTTFKIYFPRVDATAEHEIPAPSAAPRSGGPERILIVEDDEVLRALMRRVLARSGYDIVEAKDGQAALEIVAQRRNGIALVISDLIMPEMRGTELLRQIRERHPELPVLLVSGYTEDAMMRQRTFERGTAFLEKPFTPDSLVRTVRRMLDGEQPDGERG